MSESDFGLPNSEVQKRLMGQAKEIEQLREAHRRADVEAETNLQRAVDAEAREKQLREALERFLNAMRSAEIRLSPAKRNAAINEARAALDGEEK